MRKQFTGQYAAIIFMTYVNQDCSRALNDHLSFTSRKRYFFFKEIVYTWASFLNNVDVEICKHLFVAFSRLYSEPIG